MSKKSKRKLPESDVRLARTRKQELKEQSAIRKEICKRIGKIRDGIVDVGQRLVKLVNDAREVGFLILKDLERLPGKQMTIDFWIKQRSLYVDHHGNPITLENLKWCVKVAEAEKEKPVDTVEHASSWSKGLLSLANFELQGDAPGAATGIDKNYFLILTERAPKLAKEIELCMSCLEKNPRFGAIEIWQPDVIDMALSKIEAPCQQLIDIRDRLRKARGIEV